MILEDLKLLVDVAFHERHGQLGFTVGRGLHAARDRLIKTGALIRNPTSPDHVTITNAGNAFVRSLIERLDRAAFVQTVLERAGASE